MSSAAGGLTTRRCYRDLTGHRGGSASTWMEMLGHDHHPQAPTQSTIQVQERWRGWDGGCPSPRLEAEGDTSPTVIMRTWWVLHESERAAPHPSPHPEKTRRQACLGLRTHPLPRSVPSSGRATGNVSLWGPVTSASPWVHPCKASGQ